MTRRDSTQFIQYDLRGCGADGTRHVMRSARWVVIVAHTSLSLAILVLGHLWHARVENPTVMILVRRGSYALRRCFRVSATATLVAETALAMHWRRINSGRRCHRSDELERISSAVSVTIVQ